MPQELPGFYYDKEKNRYFPLKGPIPGSSRSSSSTNKAKKSSTNSSQASNFFRGTGVRISQLLQSRELNGNVITSTKGKCDFVEEFLKLQASQPLVLKYQSTEKIADSAMDQIHIDIHSAEGQTEAEALLTGSVNGSLSLFEVGKVGEHNHGVECIPDRMRPVIEENRAECGRDPGCIWRPPGASLHMSSNISCIKMCGKHSPIQRALITTLGSETSGGSVYILNLVKPVDFDSSSALAEMMHKTAAFNCTIWTADCSYNSNRAVIGKYSSSSSSVFVFCVSVLKLAWICVMFTALELGYRFLLEICVLESSLLFIAWMLNTYHYTSYLRSGLYDEFFGTNVGAALVNLETGMTSWVCRSKSDVLSQQLDPSGNVVLCGLRNGAILTVDVREKQERVSDRLIRHRIPYSSLGRQGPSSSKQWFEVKGNIYPSRTIFMPSSICSLVMLQSYDQYFLASSMDGLFREAKVEAVVLAAELLPTLFVVSVAWIKLYDQRMTKRGAVQSYEGHVNSHTRLQLGVDQSERFVMAGGEDCNLRLWSIKSGKLLFEDKISDAVLSTVCWKRSEKLEKTLNEGKSYGKCLSRQNHSWGTWFGSQEGLFYISWS
ncbi:hypothetical protein SADUNF_Sadunf01G0055600 [Salix dunnii]|uniref:Uncharacterized protein n=1 Tax=Salix dunnii TaxID=1413687 RepID=A0A835NA85_9ROSI|nr:hypothetical protein SADUNF_Sadunf01G0055600 [Salix dunnii]